jgi:hypothetical protein
VACGIPCPSDTPIKVIKDDAMAFRTPTIIFIPNYIMDFRSTRRSTIVAMYQIVQGLAIIVIIFIKSAGVLIGHCLSIKQLPYREIVYTTYGENSFPHGDNTGVAPY